MKPTIVLLAALLLFTHSHAEATTKVFILSGQSNMSGGGHVVAEGLRFEAAVGDHVRIWDASDVWGKRGTPGRWTSLNELQAIKKEMGKDMIGPEFGFARAISRPVVIVGASNQRSDLERRARIQLGEAGEVR